MSDAQQQRQSFLDVSLSQLRKRGRQVFVAYSYREYDKQDYRAPYEKVGKAFNVHFVFADEKITSLHILQKIVSYIRESQFGIYDITAWNPNVTLELGLALGMDERAFIALNPAKTNLDDVPSDLKGVDRLQYSSFATLEAELERLLSQTLPPPPPEDEGDYLTKLQDRIVEIVKYYDGIGVTNIAKIAGVNIDLARIAVRNELDRRLRSTGNTKGTKYHPK
jgi:hypothetical protein